MRDAEFEMLQRALEDGTGSPEFQISSATDELPLWAGPMDSLSISLLLCKMDQWLIAKVLLQKSKCLGLRVFVIPYSFPHSYLTVSLSPN